MEKSLIEKYPYWGDCALVFALCKARGILKYSEGDEKMKKIQETFVKKLDLYAPKSLDAKYGEYTKYDLKMNQ